MRKTLIDLVAAFASFASIAGIAGVTCIAGYSQKETSQEEASTTQDAAEEGELEAIAKEGGIIKFNGRVLSITHNDKMCGGVRYDVEVVDMKEVGEATDERKVGTNNGFAVCTASCGYGFESDVFRGLYQFEVIPYTDIKVTTSAVYEEPLVLALDSIGIPLCELVSSREIYNYPNHIDTLAQFKSFFGNLTDEAKMCNGKHRVDFYVIELGKNLIGCKDNFDLKRNGSKLHVVADKTDVINLAGRPVYQISLLEEVE